MNWRILTLTPDVIGMRMLVKARSPLGRESHFCGTMRYSNGCYVLKSDQGTYHYFRKGMTYYRVDIDEIK